MAILRNQRTLPLSLRTTTAYSINQGIVAAYDYAGGDGAPHVGSHTLGHAGTPTIVTLNNGEIATRDPSQGKTVVTPYTNLSVGPMGFGAADGKGAWTIHRRYRAPTSYSGTSSNRSIATYRDATSSNRLSIFMVESISNPWCFFFVECGSTAASMPPSTTRTTSSEFRIPYGSIVDLHITRNGDTAKFYLNGKLAATLSVPSFLLYNTAWTGLATNDGITGGNPNDLLLIDQTIWNRTLSDIEIAHHKSDPYAGYVNGVTVSDGLTVIEPTAGSTVNCEGFVIAGAYQGTTPTNVQARLAGGVWTTIAAAPTGSLYSGTFPAITPNTTGLLEVRYSNKTSVVTSVANIIAVPPAPTLTITNQPAPDGQTISVSVSYQRTNNLTVRLVPNRNGNILSDAKVVTYSTTAAASTSTFTGVPPADYTVEVVATGPAAETVVNGTAFSILGVSGGGPVVGQATITVPDAPTNVTATATSTGAVVLWNAGASNGGSAVTNSVVTASTGQVLNVSAPPAVFTLPKGVPVTFTVKDVNEVGSSASSAASNTVIPASVPGQVTGVVATVVDGGVSVAFVMPSDNGGYPITSALVEASTGELAEGATSPIFIEMPENSDATFTVKVANILGYGPASEPSNSVQPKATKVAIEMVPFGDRSVANLEGLEWAWFDQNKVSQLSTPTDKGANGTTDALGMFTVNLPNTVLRKNQTGWLIVTNSDGTVNNFDLVFSGPAGAS